MPQPILYPKVNGHVYDFSSVEINFKGLIYAGVSEISYTHGLEPGVLRGTRSGKLGRTRGEYTAEGSFSMYLEEWKLFRTALGPGFMERSFTATIHYSELGAPLQTDVLNGCRITNDEKSHSQGSDPLVAAITLDIMEVFEDGIPATMDGLLNVAGAF